MVWEDSVLIPNHTRCRTSLGSSHSSLPKGNGKQLLRKYLPPETGVCKEFRLSRVKCLKFKVRKGKCNQINNKKCSFVCLKVKFHFYLENLT